MNFPVRHVALIQQAARHQNQAGVDLTLWFSLRSAGIQCTEAIDVEKIFIEIGRLWRAGKMPDALRIFLHGMRDVAVGR